MTGPVRRALHRRRRDRQFARDMRANLAETLAAMDEVAGLKLTVQQRLDRALAAVQERDGWIYSDPLRARQFEEWRRMSALAAVDRAKEH